MVGTKRRSVAQGRDHNALGTFTNNNIHLENLAAELKVLALYVVFLKTLEPQRRGLQKHRVLDRNSLRIAEPTAATPRGPADESKISLPRSLLVCADVVAELL